MTVNAQVLMGEAGVCPIGAIIAVAWMMARGAGPFYGEQGETNSAAEFVARLWYTQPDPTPGARFAFSEEDLKKVQVQRIIQDRPERARYRCAGGLTLHIY